MDSDHGHLPASAQEVQSLRRLLAISAIVYLGWWFVVEAVLPGSFNPLPSRLGVVALFLLALGASYASDTVRRHLAFVFAAGAWILTIHYYYLMHGNRDEMPWAVGAYIVVVAVGACLPSRRSLLAYSGLTLALAGLACVLDPALRHTIFFPGLVTMTVLSNLTLRNRLLLEEERTERIRVEAARAAAEAGIAARDEFIEVASHELRTPLAALQLSLERIARAIRSSATQPAPDALEVSLERCRRQLVRLNRLVECLLEASREAGRGTVLHLEEVDLVEVVRSVAQMLTPEAARAGSVIEIGGDPCVRGRMDRVRVEQVVSNLLRNATQFGRGGPIRITVSGEARIVRLSVADDGIGIAREDHGRIFGRFERAVSSRHYGGMGLGLYIVRQIVDLHRGTVRVESELGKGAEFVVELPRRGPASTESAGYSAA